MRAHLPGSLFAPLGKTFPTVAGCYVEPEQDVYLIAAEAEVEEAVRDLVRVGLDRVVGFAPPEVLAEHAASGGELRRTEVMGFAALQRLPALPDTVVLDVRTAAEFAAGRFPGAMNISHTRLLERLEEVPAGKPVAVYCRSERASFASSLLERRGHEVIYVDDLFQPRFAAAT